MRLLPDNTYLADPALRCALDELLSEAARAWAEPQLVELGGLAATELPELGEECERTPPWLRSIDPWGERVDEVVHAPAWRRLGALAARFGLMGMPYEPGSAAAAGPEVRVVHAALCYLFEPQTATYLCPVSMTDAAARVLLDFGPEELSAGVVPRLASRDPERAWTAGQWMTEQQGGSDVGANSVAARQHDGRWRLTGRKYFCSNVDGEVALALARPDGGGPGTRGLGLFLVPQRLPGGAANRFRIDRLKDKLGTRGMATGEVWLDGAEAELVGELDRGFAQITPMLNITRMHNAIASSAGLRRGLQLARAYAGQRSAFGLNLDRQPLQRLVLSELAVRAEAALRLTLRQAGLLGRVEQGVASEAERLLFRVGSSLTKLYTARLAVMGASEVVEAFGGVGYMEDTGIARLLRDAQVLPIWEGTTNVLALDAMRVLRRPAATEALLAELDRLGSPERDRAAAVLPGVDEQSERSARRAAFTLAEAWIAGLLREAGQGRARAAAVAESWEARGEADRLPDRFDSIVDGL